MAGYKILFAPVDLGIRQQKAHSVPIIIPSLPSFLDLHVGFSLSGSPKIDRITRVAPFVTPILRHTVIFGERVVKNKVIHGAEWTIRGEGALISFVEFSLAKSLRTLRHLRQVSLTSIFSISRYESFHFVSLLVFTYLVSQIVISLDIFFFFFEIREHCYDTVHRLKKLILKKLTEPQ